MKKARKLKVFCFRSAWSIVIYRSGATPEANNLQFSCFFDSQNSQNAVKYNSLEGFSGNPLFFLFFFQDFLWLGLEPWEPGAGHCLSSKIDILVYIHYIYIYIYMYVYIYIYIYMGVETGERGEPGADHCLSSKIDTSIYLYICICVCMCICAYVCMYLCMYI